MIHSISPIQNMKYLPAATVGGYIGDAPAKSGARFGTLENTGYKKSTPNLVACFFNADSPLSRLLKSSRAFMVGCIGVVPCVLRTKPVQPAIHSINPLSGQDTLTTVMEGIMPISQQTSLPFQSSLLRHHDRLPTAEHLIGKHQEYAEAQAGYYSWLFTMLNAIKTAL